MRMSSLECYRGHYSRRKSIQFCLSGGIDSGMNNLIKDGMEAVIRVHHANEQLFSNKHMTRNEKLMVYKTMRPVVTFDSETCIRKVNIPSVYELRSTLMEVSGKVMRAGLLNWKSGCGFDLWRLKCLEHVERVQKNAGINDLLH